LNAVGVVVGYHSHLKAFVYLDFFSGVLIEMHRDSRLAVYFPLGRVITTA
jgi:hypothetical protein